MDSPPAPPAQWYAGQDGQELQSTWQSAQGTTLKNTSTLWGRDADGFNPTVCQTVTTLDGVSTSGAFTLYDQYFNVADQYEYDFGAAPGATSCSSAVPAGYGRHTHIAYIPDGVYDVVASDLVAPESNHMRNLVREKDVYDGAGNQVAKTTWGYDETSLSTPQGAPNGNTAPTHSKRGNLTSKSMWLDASNTKWTAAYGYDTLGNVVSIKDPRTDANITTTVTNPSVIGDIVKPNCSSTSFASPTRSTSTPRATSSWYSESSGVAGTASTTQSGVRLTLTPVG